MQDSFLNSPLVYSIALTLIHFLWQGALIALALKIALIFTSHQKSQLRYAFASGAMLLNFVIPLITFFIVYQNNALHLTSQLTVISVTDIVYVKSLVDDTWYANIIQYLPYLTILWLSVISILSLKFLIELYSVNQLPKNNVLTPEAELLERFAALANKIGLPKAPKLLLSLDTHVPMAIGWIKPMVLLPVSMLTGLTPAQLDMLMLHELAHIRRYDYFVNFIQSLVEIILFFHPAVLWVSNQMRNEREYCSDDIAVKYSGDPVAYAHTLADTATLCNKHRNHSIPNMAMAASGGDLTQRVLRLVNEHHCASNNQASKWFASLAVLSMVLIASSQQLITLLKMEINAASYTPKVRIIDAPLHSEVKNSNPLSTTLAQSINNKLAAQNLQNNNSIEASEPEIKADIESLISKDQTQQLTTQATNSVVKIQESTYSEIEAKLAPKVISSNKATDNLLVNLKDNPTNKSPSEIAFEKTDSSSAINASKSNYLSRNNYAQQLSELKTTLDQSNKHSQINNLSVIDALDNSKAPLILESEQNTDLHNDAELIFSVPPRYPIMAKRKGIELEVKVNFTIDENGYVKDVDFPPIKYHRNYFKSSVRYAMEKWRFIPAQHNGEAVESEMSKIFSFSLEK